MKHISGFIVLWSVVGAGLSAWLPSESNSSMVAEYCVGCHGESRPAGGLTLATFDEAAPDRQPEIAEKVIRQLRAGMMPPPGSPRPDARSVATLVHAMETAIDSAAASSPSSGWRPFQRLNRAEYARAIASAIDAIQGRNCGSVV